ncbi:hypothetical protein GCM10008934_02350 [Virgibacillus salarius]|uniref:phage tail spike protein n=1 Tax=Virgibacillus salarius TaxID=447199 RepID=UPI0031D40AAD
MIHIVDGQNVNLLDYITKENIISDNHHQSLKDKLETYTFTTFADKRFSEHLTKRNRIIIPDEDGNYREFIIFEAFKSMNRQVKVYAQASYLEDLGKARVIDEGSTGSKTNIQHAKDTLQNTIWEPGDIKYVGIRTLDIENRTNPFAFLKRLATEFNLELRFRVEIEYDRITGRYVDMVERIGDWQGREVVFGTDLINIKRREKTDNIVTALRGYGPEREDGTQLKVFVENIEALDRWGIRDPRTGILRHLIADYEPQSTDQDMTEERLITLTENELDKRVNATVEYEADIADLEHVPGLENKKIRYGDTIKIKDTKFNPPLYLEARVHTMDRSIVDKSNKKVTLGDFIEYTEEEVHDIWNELKKEIQNKIDANDLDEYTYRKQIIDSKDTEAKEGAKADVEAGKVGLPGGSIKDTISGKHLDIDLGVFGASPQFRSSELWLDGVWLSFNIGGSGNPTDKFNFDYYVFRPSKKYLTVDGAAALGVVDGNIVYGFMHVILETNSEVIASKEISMSHNNKIKDFTLTGDITGHTHTYLRFQFEKTSGDATGFPALRTRTLYMHD